MTDELTKTLHEKADALRPFSPDLAEITRKGGHQVRRRRMGVACLGIASALAVGFALPQLMDTGGAGGDREGQFAVTESMQSTWAEGSVIHVDDTTVDVGHEIHSFVATTEGFVSRDSEGNVWSTRQGETTKVGSDTQSFGRQLVADGPNAAWVEFPQGMAPRFVFLDQSSGLKLTNSDGTEPGMTNEDDTESPTSIRVFALDRGVAYFRDARGVVRLDLATQTSRVLAGPDVTVSVDDVEQGQMLHTFIKAEGLGPTVSSSDLRISKPALAVDGGDLSPDARYVMSENSRENSDDFTLVEVATGTDFTPAAKDDYQFFTGYAWIDDDSYMAFGMPRTHDDHPRVDLLECQVPTRKCAVTQEDLDITRVELPVGEHIGD